MSAADSRTGKREPRPKSADSSLETFLRIGSALAGEVELEKLLQVVTDEATELCGAAFGAFFYNAAGPDGETLALHKIAGADPAHFSNFPIPRITALFAPTFTEGLSVRLDDVAADPRFAKNPPFYGMPEAHLPVRSYLAIPVARKGREALGTMLFGHPEPGAFSKRDEALLMAVAAQATVAIENAQLYEAVSRQRDVAIQRARLAEEVGLALTGEGRVEEKLQKCTESIVRGVDAAFARIWEVDEPSNELVLRASAGIYTHLDGAHARIPVGQFKIGRIASSKSPHLTNDVAGDPNISDPEWAKREGMVSFAGYPLLVRGRVLGVLGLFAREPLSQSVLQLLGAVARQIAVALTRDRLVRERERFREQFISILGHDLRNPLNAISIAGQVLAMQDLPETSTEVVRGIQNSTDRMARMVSQLLDFARLRAGGEQTFPIHPELADLEQICRSAVAELRMAHPERAIEETYSGDTSGSFDSDRLTQVLSNLVSNALSHGAPDQPIRLSVVRAGTRVRGEVHNTGPPIPSEVMPEIFDPFVRSRGARSSGAAGLGLGLYISRQILQAHGGDLGVESSEEGGTTFRFELPAAS